MTETRFQDAPPADMTRLFLIRHGSTGPNECRPFVLQGCEINGPLTELGRRQSQAVGRFLSRYRIHAVYASSLLRAQETAAAIAAPHDLPVQVRSELRECSVGQWEGKSWEAIQAADRDGHDRFFADPVNTPHPGGESYLDLLNRVRPTINELLAKHVGQNIVVVAHNLANRVYLAELVGIDLKHARKLRQVNCCVNLLQHTAGQTELVTLNSVWHLDDQR
ncbi:MAG: histidine phosphatase family protein [Planctomycetaceae bacterium]|nr:histidine phosphatase family protein [Planctomycetaceae bacterium]